VPTDTLECQLPTKSRSRRSKTPKEELTTNTKSTTAHYHVGSQNAMLITVVEEEVCDSIIPSLHLTLNFGGPGFLGERDSGGGVWGNFGGGGRLGERGGGGGSRLGLVSPLRTLLITVVEEEFADSSVPDLHLTLDLSSPDLMDAGDRGGGVRAREVDEVCKGEVF